MGPETSFAVWLSATMRTRGLSQAQLAREVGVADVQVSRWRRGNTVPSVRYLQRIATALDVPRVSLESMAGYPVDADDGPVDPALEAELQALTARFRQTLEDRLPRQLWGAYLETCEALADDLAASFETARSRVEGRTGRTIGFHMGEREPGRSSSQ